MATFGKTVKGGSSTTISERLFGTKATLPVDAVITKMTAYIKTAVTAQKYKLCIYADVAGSPAGLEAVTIERSLSSQDQDEDFLFASNPTLAAGDYWLGIMSDGVGSGIIYYDGVGNTEYKNITYNAPPNPFGASTSLVREYTIYATYTPLGGGSVSNVSLISLGLGAWLALQKKKKRMKKSVLAARIARDAMKPMVKYFKKVDEAIKKAV